MNDFYKMHDNHFQSLDCEERMKTTDKSIKCAPIRVKTGAFIGTDIIILSGVVIGEELLLKIF